MSITVVLGAQWGDEGKGKLVDFVGQSSTLFARCAGGNNAGHTIKHNGITYDFHLLPSGFLNPKANNLIGSGCVVHLPGLFKEIEDLESKGVERVRERLFVSERAHVVTDLHQRVDGLEERELENAVNGGGKGKIGTTGKGIGPTYSTKMARSGLRIADLYSDEQLEGRLRALAAGYRKRYGDEALAGYDVEAELTRLKEYRVQLAGMVIDQLPLLVDVQKQGVPVLVEGANAIMLDVDAGTYPFVTSSNTGLGGVFTGLSGIRPTSVRDIYGVVKAYTTRVGSGIMPSEDLGPAGVQLQDVGRDFGVTTGRRRRCGWLDLVVVRYSAQVNGYTALNLTKLDVLDGFAEIKVAVKYKDKETGEEIEGYPADLERLASAEVVYETLEGWNEDITKAKRWEDLPEKCRKYVEFVEEFVGVKCKFLGTGPDRTAMIVR